MHGVLNFAVNTLWAWIPVFETIFQKTFAFLDICMENRIYLQAENSLIQDDLTTEKLHSD